MLRILATNLPRPPLPRLMSIGVLPELAVGLPAYQGSSLDGLGKRLLDLTSQYQA
jgi:hypothetical protein